ncbi:hypothetical protein E2562_029441, partial [Oryza meyeriana var. granulata]
CYSCLASLPANAASPEASVRRQITHLAFNPEPWPSESSVVLSPSPLGSSGAQPDGEIRRWIDQLTIDLELGTPNRTVRRQIEHLVMELEHSRRIQQLVDG